MRPQYHDFIESQDVANSQISPFLVQMIFEISCLEIRQRMKSIIFAE